MGTRRRRGMRWALPLVGLLAAPALAACGASVTAPRPTTVTVASTTSATPVAAAPITPTSTTTAAPTTTPTTTTAAPTTTLPPGGTAIPITSPAAAPSGGRTPPNCPTAQLSITLGQGEGTAGSVYRSLVFTNTGPATCQLRGYPGVSDVAGDDGHRVGPAAEENGPRTGEVDLEPRESAHAVLRSSNTGNYPEDTCRPTQVRGYRVYPPGDTAAAYVPSPGIGCAGDVITLHVQPMRPGRGPGAEETGDEPTVDPGPPPPDCTTSALSFGLGDIEGEAGGYFRPLVFTNIGGSRCALRGYPAVEYVAGDDGHRVGVPAKEVGPLSDRVDLDPGDSAHARLQVTDHGNYSDDACGPTHARGLRVHPPGEDAAAYLPAPGTTCSEDIPILQILTVRPGKA